MPKTLTLFYFGSKNAYGSLRFPGLRHDFVVVVAVAVAIAVVVVVVVAAYASYAG